MPHPVALLPPLAGLLKIVNTSIPGLTPPGYSLASLWD
jgi:hypothetical protein